MRYLTEPLAGGHDRSDFSCGIESLDAFLKTQAGQHMKKSHASVTFVQADEDKRVRAYYTLSNDGIPYAEIPEPLRKLMPRYRNLGVTLIARLAVHKAFQNSGTGTQMLMDALARSYDIATGAVGSVAVVVDAINEPAAVWYEKCGFMRLHDQNRLFLPMATVDKLF